MNKLIFSFFLIIVVTKSFSQAKPQEPIPPFPYESEELLIFNDKDSVNIGATLTKPAGIKNYAVAILLSGSGAQNRNSELLGHKPFLFISDYLTKNNIAVLTMDDRGVGTSTGNYNTITFQNLKDDVQSVLSYLRKREDIDKSKIGLIGHSLGGIIAPMVAEDDKEIAFIIMLAGSGIRGDELMLKQKELIESKMGIAKEIVVKGQENMNAVYKAILAYGNNIPELKDSLISHFKSAYGDNIPQVQLNGMLKQLTTPWLLDFIRHDPKQTLMKVKCPLLALGGSSDLQVPSTVNLEAIKSAVKEGGNKNVETVEFPKLNHLFQECETGLPAEYTTIEQTFSPQVVEKMVSWLKENGMIKK